VTTQPWTATVLTIFPEMFPGPLAASLVGKALERDLWRLRAVDIRAFAPDRHGTVDDTPFGGGAGMVMRPDVVARALDAALAEGAVGPLVYLSPRGAPLRQERVRGLAAGPGVVLLCGRYEGVDARVVEARGFEEISLGDFVLSGGEIAAMALLDACVRLLPGVLGDPRSAEEESFAGGGLLEHPHYTRPQVWEGRAVPEVLLSGHHGRIAAWRRQEALRVTRERRPDLLPAALTGNENARPPEGRPT
jgi:tRNA (guanine37-N1)-methyltransferase